MSVALNSILSIVASSPVSGADADANSNGSDPKFLFAKQSRILNFGKDLKFFASPSLSGTDRKEFLLMRYSTHLSVTSGQFPSGLSSVAPNVVPPNSLFKSRIVNFGKLTANKFTGSTEP